jgi:hypothetical protein
MRPEILPPWQGEYTSPSARDYVVVVTRYPTTCGANGPLLTSRARFAQMTDMDIYGPGGQENKNSDPNDESFVKYEDALRFSRALRDDKSGI